MIPTPTRVRDIVEHPAAVSIDPFEFSYFTDLTDDQWKRAKSLARRVMGSTVDTEYGEYMKSHGPVEKAGELVFKGFLEYNCNAAYDTNLSDEDPYAAPFAISGLHVSVHTRMLKRDPGMPHEINTRRFQLMVPRIGLTRRADIYVFCGFDVDSKTGFALGWATADEIAEKSIVGNLKYPAKCLSVHSAHPMHLLLPSIEAN